MWLKSKGTILNTRRGMGLLKRNMFFTMARQRPGEMGTAAGKTAAESGLLRPRTARYSDRAQGHHVSKRKQRADAHPTQQ